MNHSNFKSLAFYGITIVSVLLLFKTVSLYGETNLKAPPVIKGRYPLVLAEDLSNCQKSEELILKIQQSGIYLNAYLLLENTNAETPKNYQTTYSFLGILKNQKLSLSGKIDRSILCNIASIQNPILNSATMQIQLLDQENFIGQLTVNGSLRPLKFTAIPQKCLSVVSDQWSVAKKSRCRLSKDRLFYPILSTIKDLQLTPRDKNHGKRLKNAAI
jgi:hypothetical protein